MSVSTINRQLTGSRASLGTERASASDAPSSPPRGASHSGWRRPGLRAVQQARQQLVLYSETRQEREGRTLNVLRDVTAVSKRERASVGFSRPHLHRTGTAARSSVRRRGNSLHAQTESAREGRTSPARRERTRARCWRRGRYPGRRRALRRCWTRSSRTGWA